MEHVIRVIRLQPRLSKEASSVLVELGETVQATATRHEISALVHGSLSQETHVRNSCLQAIQVRHGPGWVMSLYSLHLAV